MNKKNLILFVSLFVIAAACNKEEPILPVADFTTNIENSTLTVGQGFIVYLDQAQGEFMVYFRGHTEASTYDPAVPSRIGTSISQDSDSVVVIGYPLAGEYVFTLVASSSGNWAQDYVQDVKQTTITVIPKP